MERYDIINSLIEKYNFQTYLEIGVSHVDGCFNKIKASEKTGVDPNTENIEFNKTSDEFFFELEQGNTRFSRDYKWDLIFVDGLHLANQSYKDIKNSLKHVKKNGFIIVHDCNPPSGWFARENYLVDGFYAPWNGTVWKAFYKVRTEGLNIETCTVNTDWGVGVIKNTEQKSKNKVEFDNMFFEFNKMAENRAYDLGLLTTEHFFRWIETV